MSVGLSRASDGVATQVKTIRERRAPPLFKNYQMFRWPSWTLNEAPLIPLERVMFDLENQILDPGWSFGDLVIPLGANEFSFPRVPPFWLRRAAG